jgi:hypothetical protein
LVLEGKTALPLGFLGVERLLHKKAGSFSDIKQAH